jgi:amino acid adenylation domain-containing protein/non-ribosomal peptide synthase protein (TIGR01720 family)
MVSEATREQLVGFPLSPQQQRLWRWQRTAPDADSIGGMRLEFVVSLEGTLDWERLQAAWHRIVRRHEILRTGFKSIIGLSAPLQVIADHAPVDLAKADWRKLGPDEIDQGVEQFFHTVRQLPVINSAPPLLQGLVCRLSAERYRLCVSIPTLCADAATAGIIVRELSEAYADVEGSDATEELLQYVQFAAWQNELLSGKDGQAEQAFWRNHPFWLHSALPPHFLNSSTVADEFSPVSITYRIEPEIAAELDTIARNCGVSVAVILLACWQILLARLSGQLSVDIGYAVDGRKYSELERLPGLATKFVPLQTSLRAGMRFDRWLSEVAEAGRVSEEWQEGFQFAINSGQTGLAEDFFGVCFEFTALPGRITAGGLSFELHRVSSCVDRFQLCLSAHRFGADLATTLAFDPRAMGRIEAERISRHFHTLLLNAARQTDAPIDQLDLLDEEARRELLVTFNQAAPCVDHCLPVHRLFADQAARTPDAIAISFGDQLMTFHELDRRANQLAHYLRAHGVGPEVLVGVLLENSVELLVTLFGVLKAGAAYLPFDPSSPPARTAFILADSRAAFLLTQTPLEASLSNDPVFRLRLDADEEAIADEAETEPQVPLLPEHLAYVIYTSGSTGQPKGSMITHRGLSNYLGWAVEAYAVAEGEGTVLHSSIAFDMSVTSLFAPLLAGKRVVLAHSAVSSVERLGAVLNAENGFSFIKVTPAHARLLAHQLPPEEAQRSAQHLILGGEALTWADVEWWSEVAPEMKIVNEYGPTETVVGCSFYRAPCNQSPGAYQREAIPIGQPIANTRIYVLDEYLQPVPIGAPGELYVAGAGLARGYFRRQGVSAEHFIPDPFSDELGARLYRTGDFARYLPDGNLEYLGRRDQQVKIRGFRVEPGEVEAALGRQGAIKESVVVASSTAYGSKCLIAYLVLKPGYATPSTDELRDYLATQLPDYMLPASFMILDALPLGAGGKIDLRALPDPDDRRASSSAGRAVPRTPAEKILVDLWAQVLRRPEIGIHDNFFALGGDSILGLQVIARGNQRGLRLTVQQLFQHQTVAELARVAEPGGQATCPHSLSGPAPLAPAQHWFFEHVSDCPNHYNQSVLLTVAPSVDRRILQQAVEAVVMHHRVLHTRLVRTEGQWQQVQRDEPVAGVFSYLDLSSLGNPVREMERSAARLQASLNIEHGPLARAVCFELGAGAGTRLLLIIHHLVIDGVSWRILLEDLQTVYDQLRDGGLPELPVAAVSFGQWAYALTEYAASGISASEGAYWLASRQEEIQTLPRDSSGDNTCESEQAMVVELGREQTRVLLEDVPRLYRIPVQETLLAAVVGVITEWTGGDQVLIELEGHGREEIIPGLDISRTVGWFTSIVPVLLKSSRFTTVEEKLRSMHEQLRGIPRRGIEYGILRYLGADREMRMALAEMEEAEVLFNYLGQFDQVLKPDSVLGSAAESVGPEQHPYSRRTHVLVLSAAVANGRLSIVWQYSRNLHRKETIERLANSFHQVLEQTVAACSENLSDGSDVAKFPLSGLNKKQLGKVMQRLRDSAANKPSL